MVDGAARELPPTECFNPVNLIVHDCRVISSVYWTIIFMMANEFIDNAGSLENVLAQFDKLDATSNLGEREGGRER